MNFLAIDPGPTESAYVRMNYDQPIEFRKVSNEWLADHLPLAASFTDRCVIERIASYGMSVGAEVFETCVWTGRFIQAYGPDRIDRIRRLDIKTHLCHDSRAKDANIRQSLIDRFGGKDRAVGKKANPGPLFGMSGDCWAALAVGVTWHDLNSTEAKRKLFQEKQKAS